MLKRIVDIVLSSLGLLLSLPILFIVGTMIYFKLGRPLLFRQIRPGRGGKPFQLLKFRTMLAETSKEGRSLTDEERLTPFGQWLRRTSLDELPELWNILRGDMSLVGPRPLLMEYLPLYDSTQRRRHEVLPGLTGWAQVNGRNAISWEEKFKLDVWYVDNQSLWLDLKIIGMTVMKVLKKEDISAAGEATMPAFKGTKC